MDTEPSALRREAMRRLRTPEDGFTERKQEGVKPEEVRRTLVAFANSVPEGERAFLYLGVTDGGEVVGVRSPDELQKRIRTAAAACYPAIVYQGFVLDEGDKQVVAIAVEASQNRPHFAGRAFVRQGSVSVTASERVFEELIASRASPFRELQRARGLVVTLCAWTDLGFGTPGPAAFGARPGWLNWYEHPASLAELEPHCVTFEILATRQRRSVPIAKVTVFHDTARYRPAVAIEGGP